MAAHFMTSRTASCIQIIPAALLRWILQGLCWPPLCHSPMTSRRPPRAAFSRPGSHPARRLALDFHFSGWGGRADPATICVRPRGHRPVFQRKGGNASHQNRKADGKIFRTALGISAFTAEGTLNIFHRENRMR